MNDLREVRLRGWFYGQSRRFRHSDLNLSQNNLSLPQLREPSSIGTMDSSFSAEIAALQFSLGPDLAPPLL